MRGFPLSKASTQAATSSEHGLERDFNSLQPGSVTLAGFLALIAPCGGSSGLPKEAAAAAVVDIAAPAAAVARTSRLENIGLLLHVRREPPGAGLKAVVRQQRDHHRRDDQSILRIVVVTRGI